MARTAAGLVVLGAVIGCMPTPDTPPDAATGAALDAVHARIVTVHLARDPAAYAELHSDSVVFDWPGLPPIRGRRALEALMRDNWARRDSLHLSVWPVARRLAGAQATEVLAYEEAWTDPAGARVSEFGRFVLMLTRADDGRWYIDRFLGFSDSTRTAP